MKKYINKIAIALTIITPVVSFAALQGIKDLVTAAKGIINLTIPVMFGLALLFFFWGVAQFILHSDDEKVREGGKQRMLWGIVALFIIVSIYGIIGFVGDSLGIETGIKSTTTSSGLGTMGPGPGDCGSDPTADGCAGN